MSDAGAAHAAYYRPAEVACMLRCSEWWVKEQARRRRIPFCWIGGSYLFTEEHVGAIVRLFEVRPDQDPQPATGGSRSVRPSVVPDADPPARLRARRPRRARGHVSGTTAA
jgi:hypothetical protein